MPGAVRLGDKAQVEADAHGCPACPHPGVGPVVTGSANVLINSKPAARQDDLGIHAVCCGPNNFTIAKGSPTVYVNGKPLARIQDKTRHCGGSGPLIEGSPDVLIDDGAAAASALGKYAAGALQILLAKAAKGKQRKEKKISDQNPGTSPTIATGAPEAPPAAKPAAKTQPAAAAVVSPGEVQVQVVGIDGTPQPGLEFELTLPDGKKQAGKTDDQGSLKLSGLPKSGDCTLDLPDVKPASQADPSTPGRLRFVEGGIKVAIGAASVVEVPPRARRGRLTGLLFETNKAFLKPEAMTGIQMLKKLYKSVPKLVVLVSGHTDRVGDALFNRGLSEERADAVKHFLIDDADEWMKWYAGKKPHSKPWGVREDQHMLRTVVDGSKNPFYSGPVNGTLDTATKQAIGDFQDSRLLTRTGKPDNEIRRALVEAYMKLDDAPLPRDPPIASHGCGKTHPVSPPGTPPEEQVDRRVEIFLFEGQIDPKPRTPCPPGGCTEYPRWVAQTVLTVDLDKPPGALAVTVVGEDNQPIAGADIHASGPLSLDSISVSGGPAKDLDRIVPGSYKVIAEKAGFFAADATVVVPEGGTKQVRLTLRAQTFDLDVLVEDQSKPPKPLQGAVVSISAPGASSPPTDPSGKTRFLKLPVGTHRLSAAHKGFQAGSASVTLGGGAAAKANANQAKAITAPAVTAPAGAGTQGAPTVIALAPQPVAFQVRVVDDEDGSGLPNASVAVTQGPGPVIRTQTRPTGTQGQTGFATTDGFVEDEVEISVTLDGFQKRDKVKFTPSSSQTSSVDIRLKGAFTVHIEARDEDGNAVTGVVIAIVGPSPRTQDSRGNDSVDLKDLKQGSYTARGSKSGFDEAVPVPFTLPRNFAPVRITLTGRVDLGVKVTDRQSGVEIDGASVSVQRKGDSPAASKTALTGAGAPKGFANFPAIPRGTYEVRVQQVASHRSAKADPDPALKGSTVIEVKLDHTAAVSFEALNSLSKERIIDGKVELRATGPETPALKVETTGFASAALVIGKYDIEAKHAGFETLTIPQLDVPAADGRTQNVPLPLLPEVRLTIHVQGSSPLQPLQGATIVVTPTGKAPLTQGRSDPAGEAKFGPLDLVAHAFKVIAPNHRPGQGTTAAMVKGQNDANISLLSTNGVVLDFVDRARKQPVTGVHLEMVGSGETQRGDTLPPPAAPGKISLDNVLAGDYQAQVTHPDFVTIPSLALQVPGGDKGPLKRTIELVDKVTLDAFVRFEIWNVVTKAFEPLGGLDAEAVDDQGNVTLHAVATDASGVAHFEVPQRVRAPGKPVDLFFRAKTSGRTVGGATLPAQWSTKGWSQPRATPGLQKAFTGSSLGTAAAPIIFRVGLDYHLAIKYRFKHTNSEGVAFPEPEETRGAVQGVSVTLYRRRLVLDKFLQLNEVLDRIAFDETDAAGQVHGLTFLLNPGDDVMVAVENPADKPSHPTIHNDAINLPLTTVHHLREEQPVWRSAKGDADSPLLEKNADTSIDTQLAPRVFLGTGERAATMFIFQVLTEWSRFLFRVTGGLWTGLPNLQLFTFTHLGTNINSYSFPKGVVNFVPKHHFHRETIVHELSHQIMWKESLFPATALGLAFTSNPVHFVNLRATQLFPHLGFPPKLDRLPSRVLPLYEGWAELIEAFFTVKTDPGFNGNEFVFDDLDDPTNTTSTPTPLRVARGAPPNLGFECEGAFANAVFGIFRSVVGGRTPVPETTDGNWTGAAAAGVAWMDDPTVRARWKSLIWEPLQSLRGNSNPKSSDFLAKLKEAALRDNLWHLAAPHAHRQNMMMDPPTIGSLAPASGPAAGTDIVVTGTEFAADFQTIVAGVLQTVVETTVEIDGVPVSANVVSATRLEVRAPVRAAGDVQVVVKTAAGSSAPAKFTVLP